MQLLWPHLHNASTITTLTVNNCYSSCAVWCCARYQPFCHIVHLVLITGRCRMPQNVFHLAMCTSSPKPPSKFRSVSSHLYGNRILLSVIQSLYCHVVKLKVCFFDICKVPSTIEERPEDCRECTHGNDYAEEWQVCRNTWLTGVSLLSLCVKNSNKQTVITQYV